MKELLKQLTELEAQKQESSQETSDQISDEEGGSAGRHLLQVKPPSTGAISVGTNIPQGNSFVFLSVFKMEDRKNWQGLLQSFFQEFSLDPAALDHIEDPAERKLVASENARVCLVIRTYLYLDPEPRNKAKVVRKILDFATTSLGIPQEHIPCFDVLTNEFSMSDMPRLYAGAHAFVLPSHGEGWGLPFMEAMAMELPTIGTEWSGNVDFMNHKNSFLIKVLSPLHQLHSSTGVVHVPSTDLSDIIPPHQPVFAGSGHGPGHRSRFHQGSAVGRP